MESNNTGIALRETLLDLSSDYRETNPVRSCVDHGTRTGHRHVPEGRTLHLIDIENLLGDPHDVDGVSFAIANYLSAAEWREGDHIVLAGHPDLLLATREVTGMSFRMLPAYGVDGADKALLADTSDEFMFARFCRVAIGSGDHIFADLASRLGTLGASVWVIARIGSLAKRLGMAATRVVLIDLSSTSDLKVS